MMLLPTEEAEEPEPQETSSAANAARMRVFMPCTIALRAQESIVLCFFIGKPDDKGSALTWLALYLHLSLMVFRNDKVRDGKA